MELFNFDPAVFMSFLLVFFRISIILFLLPFFGGSSIPNPVKAALSIILTLTLWHTANFPPSLFPANPFNILILILGELVLGLILGLMTRFLFGAIQTGGQLIGFSMGFAMVNVVDPDTGTSEAITAHFLYMVSLLTFLSLNGHLLLLKALTESFKYVPPGELFLSPGLVKQVLSFSGILFTLAIKIASPVIAAIFLVDLALALVGRAAPQMNVLMMGFPLKISVGFMFVGMMFEVLAMYMKNFIIGMGPMFTNLLKAAH